VKATGFNLESLTREFAFLGRLREDRNEEYWVDLLDPEEEVTILKVNDDLMGRVLRQDGGGGAMGSSWNDEHGCAVLANGDIVELAAAGSYRPATGYEKEWGADNIGTQIADYNVEYVVICTSYNAGTWDDNETERSITIYKMSDYDLSGWARAQRQQALEALEAEMAVANLFPND